MSRPKIKKKLSPERFKRLAREHGISCVLCGGDPDGGFGMFSPKDERTDAGRPLLFPYAFCRKCGEYHLPEVQRVVEEQAAESLSGFTLNTLDVDGDGTFRCATYGRAPMPSMN
jgi:hypothetical protein